MQKQDLTSLSSQEGDGNTQICNNGLGEWADLGKVVNLKAEQEGNENFSCTNNARCGGEAELQEKHNQGVAMRSRRHDSQKQAEGRTLGGDEEVALLEVRAARAKMLDGLQGRIR